MTDTTRRITILRFLRVAFTAVCTLLCVLVVVFWVRSYSYADTFFLRLIPTGHIQAHTGDARMCVWFERKPIRESRWSSRRLSISEHTSPSDENRIPWFDLAFWPTFARLYTAHWFLAVVAGSLAIVPWCPRKFNIRGLLILVTAVAVVSGVIAWVDRSF